MMIAWYKKKQRSYGLKIMARIFYYEKFRHQLLSAKFSRSMIFLSHKFYIVIFEFTTWVKLDSMNYFLQYKHTWVGTSSFIY